MARSDDRSEDRSDAPVEQQRHTARLGGKSHAPHITLNTDGRRHPRENALAVTALVLGIISLLTAFDRDLHFIGAATGLAGIAVGLYDQYISATRAERMVIVPAIGASAVGFALALAHGGFTL